VLTLLHGQAYAKVKNCNKRIISAMPCCAHDILRLGVSPSNASLMHVGNHLPHTSNCVGLQCLSHVLWVICSMPYRAKLLSKMLHPDMVIWLLDLCFDSIIEFTARQQTARQGKVSGKLVTTGMP